MIFRISILWHRFYNVFLIPKHAAMKRVFVLAGGSENAFNPINYARKLFDKVPATFCLKHVYKALEASQSHNEYDVEWLDVPGIN